MSCLNVNIPYNTLLCTYHSNISSIVPVDEEALTAKFVWGQVLSENLARLSQNHFATRHYLTQQVLPTLQNDLEDLRNFAIELQSDQELAAYEHWIENYREVIIITTLILSCAKFFFLFFLKKKVCHSINKRYCGLCIYRYTS